MQVALATVDRKILEKSCHSVVLPTAMGQIEVLKGHAALVAELATGLMRVKERENESGEVIILQSGFVQVANDQVRVLAQVAELPSEVDINASRSELKQLTDKLAAEGLSNDEIKKYNQRISLIKVRLKAAEAN